MRATLFLCSQSSAVDVRRNTISVFHILEELAAPAFPIVIQALSIVAMLELDENEPADPRVLLRILLGDQQLFEGPFQADFRVRRKARALADFNGLVIPAPGVLNVLLHAGDRDIATWQIICHQIAPPQLDLRFAPEPGERPAEAHQAPGD